MLYWTYSMNILKITCVFIEILFKMLQFKRGVLIIDTAYVVYDVRIWCLYPFPSRYLCQISDFLPQKNIQSVTVEEPLNILCRTLKPMWQTGSWRYRRVFLGAPKKTHESKGSLQDLWLEEFQRNVKVPLRMFSSPRIPFSFPHNATEASLRNLICVELCDTYLHYLSRCKTQMHTCTTFQVQVLTAKLLTPSQVVATWAV